VNNTSYSCNDRKIIIRLTIFENSPLCQPIVQTRSQQLTEQLRPTFKLSLYLTHLILLNYSDAKIRVHLFTLPHIHITYARVLILKYADFEKDSDKIIRNVRIDINILI